jgi:hypothetical protein
MSLLDDVARRDSWRCWVYDEPVDADRQGAVKVVIAWPDRLHVVEPAALITVAERLERKGDRELVARCPSRKDAQEAADWLVDRFSRLVPGLPVTASVNAGGGQYLVALATGRR